MTAIANTFQPYFLALIVSLPLIGFLFNGSLALIQARTGTRVYPRFVGFIACLMPILAFGLAVISFIYLVRLDPELRTINYFLSTWFQTDLLNVNFAFFLDPLSALMTLIVTGVGSLIHLYSLGYMKEDKSFVRFFAYLNLFLFFMLVLVLSDNLLFLFVGWEGVGLASYLLIGFWFDDSAKAKAGKKAFVVNRIGDFGFLVALFLVIVCFFKAGFQFSPDFFEFSLMQENLAVFERFAPYIAFFLFIGATGKSAQIPLYVWLPDAMAGPTPVSALIHAATMVTAGIYMIARLFFLFELAPGVLEIIAWGGAATALLAALIAITQYDIKKVLAYSTVSQLGYMFLALGVGAPQSALFHVMTHAFFKACLFLCAGSVIHALHHEQDIRKMGGLKGKLKWTHLAFLISTIAIAGIPPFSGFFSKDEILYNTWLSHQPVLYGIAFFTAGLTAFYMFRLYTYVFLGKPRFHKVDPLPFVMRWPVMVLAVLAIVGGFVGIPHALGGHNYFHDWLHYLSTAKDQVHSVATEIKLMLASVAWALGLSLLAIRLYRKNLDWTTGLKNRTRPLYHLMQNKFYIDEIYHALIVAPIGWISRNLLFKVTDKGIIDGMVVNGSGYISLFFARLVSLFQTGILNHYILYIWLGLVFLIYWIVQK